MQPATSVVVVAALCCGGCFLLPNRAGNSAPEVHAFPDSVAPALHSELIGLIEPKQPFNDKTVKKIAVTEDWSPWVKDHGVDTQTLRTTVGVFDPQNSKCWVWNQVYFKRPRDGQVAFAIAQLDVNEIDCSLLDR